MKFFKILAIVALWFGFASAIDKSQIESVMSAKVKTAVEILRDGSPKDGKPAKIFALFDEYFDYETMAKLSLSKHYKSLSAAELKEFNKAYEKHLKSSFIDKLSLYTNQDMKVLGVTSPNDKRTYLKTQIIGEDKNYDIDFKFYPATPNDWKIYDVDIISISIVQTYRSQFGDVVENLSFNELLKRLNQTTIANEK